MRLYISNFPYQTTDRELAGLFAPFGVSDAIVLRDRETGRSKGFGFVTIKDDQAELAVSQLHDSNFGGRQLRIAPAIPRMPRAAA
jgi:RNA recognition motif-containing protein